MADDDPWQVLHPSKPAMNAPLYLKEMYSHSERCTIASHRGEWLVWVGTHWKRVPEVDIERAVYMKFKDAIYPTPPNANNPNGGTADFDINPAKTAALMQAIRNHAFISSDIDAPELVEPTGMKPIFNAPMKARDIISLRNCILHVPNRQWMAHTPRFFNTFAVDCDYEVGAGYPKVWIDFLNSVFPTDPESVDCLQEIFGYLLTHRNEQQKMFMLYGDKRSGKGTIVRVLESLLGGNHNVASTSVSALNQPHGLANLEYKGLAVMPDLRFNAKDSGVAVENLLKITGDDVVTINKKFKPQYDVRLTCRFLIVSNELPKLRDDSGALQSRLVLLHFTESFLGREDTELTDKLRADLPGIFNWALDGLDRLTARGKFVQPKSGIEALGLVTSLASPVLEFISDMCVIGADYDTPKADLYEEWRMWCERNGHRTSSSSSFAKSLRAAIPKLKDGRPRATDGTRERHWQGIRLADGGSATTSAGQQQQWIAGLRIVE